MEIHVAPDENGNWIVQTYAVMQESIWDTQADAEARAREVLEARNGGELVIHGKDGEPRSSVEVTGPTKEANVSEVHVVPHETGEGWQVIDNRAGLDYKDSSYDTQDEAVARARTLLEANESGGELVLHGKDGKVRDTTHIDYKPEES